VTSTAIQPILSKFGPYLFIYLVQIYYYPELLKLSVEINAHYRVQIIAVFMKPSVILFSKEIDNLLNFIYIYIYIYIYI